MSLKKICICVCAFAASQALFGAWAVKDGETVAFLGDSITQGGQQHVDGYVNLILRGLAQQGIRVKPIKAGISGHKSNDMLGRLQRDVLDKKPQWMTLSCGVNDVWHFDFNRGVPLEAYKTNITAILDRCAAANCRVIVMTATLFENEDLIEGRRNKMLAPYNAFLRAEATRRGLPLADLNAMMHAAHAKDANVKLTRDGVHMLTPGNQLMARGVLQAMGADEASLATIAAKAWKHVWVLCRFDLKPGVSRREYIEKTKAVLAAVRAEEGCLEYRLLEDDATDWDRPQRFGAQTFWALEHWAGESCLKAHLEAPHMKAFGPTVRPLRAGSTFHVLQDACE